MCWKNMIRLMVGVSIPYRYKQNEPSKKKVFDDLDQFQSPIGTNKTPQSKSTSTVRRRSFNPLQVQTKHSNAILHVKMLVWFQSPIGTNKTRTIVRTYYMVRRQFQSPIGTNKTQDVLFHHKNGTQVSIPYRYKQNPRMVFFVKLQISVSIPYRYKQN